MTEQQQKERPQPVVTSQLDAGIAARDAQAKADQAPEVKETPAPKAETPPVEQNDPEGTAASETEDAQQAKPKPKGVGKRIDELTREKYDAQRERDYWREQAMRGNVPQQSTQRQEPVAEAATDEPTLESCNFDQGAYVKAWYQWQRGQESKVEAEKKKAETARERAQRYQESAASFAEQNEDFYDVTTNPNLRITAEMVEAITETDNPAAVAYYLAKDPTEAARIAGLSPIGIGRAITAIESKLAPAATPATPPQLPAKTVTKAPPPVTTVSGAPPVRKELTQMSMKEYDEERRRQRKAKGIR